MAFLEIYCRACRETTHSNDRKCAYCGEKNELHVTCDEDLEDRDRDYDEDGETWED